MGTTNINPSNPDSNQGSSLIEDIINGMFDWVRVLDRNDNIIYINKAMSEALDNLKTGEKCYKAIGRSAPCENCISRRTVFEGQSHEKEETIKDRIYSVMSSPVKDQNGEIIAVVEVLRDITQMKLLQKKITEQNHKLQSDLRIARKLQCSLLPKSFPEDKISFSFIYRPCETIGGDFLDIFKIDEDHVGVYIADVSGHGVPASMLTVFLRSSINKKLLSPAAVLKELYNEFNNSNFDQDLYITVFYAIFSLKENKIRFSNAGHNVCPILFNKGKFEILRSAGIPISNWMTAPDYSDKFVNFTSGDKVFLYTDGIVELKNDTNEQYGEKRLLDILLNASSGSGETLNNIADSACKFAGIDTTAEIPDDITMALVEIR
ncbi:MAG: SpoIIE family protein phosphatase [Clostridia bacterium]|nr:SpoIIE family protein phosphatase [Clostridia bacterium]